MISMDFSKITTELNKLTTAGNNTQEALQRFRVIRDTLTNLVEPLSKGSAGAQTFSQEVINALNSIYN
jgi:hypothetical protein